MAIVQNLERVRSRAEESPFNKLLGLKLQSIDEEKLVASCFIRPEFVGNPELGAAHGGLIGSLIDAACTFVIMPHLDTTLVTIDLRIDYHRPAKAGTTIIIESYLVKLGRKLSSADARVFSETGKLLASGRSVFMHIDPK